MRTIYGTKVRPLRLAGAGDAKCAQCVMCLAHPDDKGRSFTGMVAVDDIEGGVEAVREYFRSGVDVDAPPPAPPPSPPKAAPKRQSADNFGDL